jgi:hypothetical protein
VLDNDVKLTVDENVVGTAMQEFGLSIPKPKRWNVKK